MKLGLWVTDRELIAESEALAAHYRALAEELGLGFADAGRWDISLAYDGVHLTEDGHRTFAGSLYEALTTIMEKENEA